MTPETPMTTIGGGISFPTRRDNTVFLTTDHLSFWLQVSNGSSSNPPASASAVGIIYDYAAAARSTLERAVKYLDLAVQTQDGTVIGTHASVQLDGGPDFDEEETIERLLTEDHAVSGLERDSLEVRRLERGEQSSVVDFLVDPSTGRADGSGTGSAQMHPFRS